MPDTAENKGTPHAFDGSPFVHELMKAVIVHDTDRFIDVLKVHECRFQWLNGTVEEKRTEVYGRPYDSDSLKKGVYFDAVLVIKQPTRKGGYTQIGNHFFEIKTGYINERLLAQLDRELQLLTRTHLSSHLSSLTVIIPYRSIGTLWSEIGKSNPQKLGRQLHLIPLEWFADLLLGELKILSDDIHTLSADANVPWAYKTRQVARPKTDEKPLLPQAHSDRLEDYF